MVLPLVPEGVIVNAFPLQIFAIAFGITGIGLTVIVIVNVAPTQFPAAPDVGVTVYTIVCGAFVVLTSVCAKFDCAVEEVVCPVILLLSDDMVQVYVVFAGTISIALTGLMAIEPPLQIVAVLLAMDGLGLTVTFTLNVEPVQLPVFTPTGLTT